MDESMVAEVTRWLHQSGRPFRYLGLRSFPSPTALATAHTTAVWVDDKLAMTWVLVPAGVFSPGYSDEKLRSLLEQARLMSSAAEAPDQPVPTLEDIAPYGSHDGWNPGRLRQRSPERVAPFLISALPVLQSTPGIDRLIDARAVRAFRFNPGAHKALAVSTTELPRILEVNRWQLPSVAAYEWALRGGVDVLFPWGDTLPTWLHWTKEGLAEVERTIERVGAAKSHGERPSEEFGDARDALFWERFPYDYDSPSPPWERANRFGVIDGNVVSCWCTEGDCLYWMGGAGGCYPWQGCCEWANFLVTAAVEYKADGKPFGQPWTHAIRPVIPIDR